MKLDKTRVISMGLLISTASVMSVSANAATGVTPPASQKVQFKVSGQVSRALTFADNGTQSDTLFVDNTNSGSRVRIVGKVGLSNNLSAGINIETQFEDNKSYSLDIGDSDNNNVFTSRKRDLWFKGGWGKLSLGKGDGAANNTSEADNSGTWIANNSGDFLHSGLSFVDSNGGKVKMKQAFSNFDGLSRNNRIRYDTPRFGPVGMAFSKKQKGTEFALTYNQPMGGGSKLTGAVGYVKDDASNFKQLGLSTSYLTAGGLSLTGHYGKRNLAGTSIDPSGYYVKVGQKLGAAKNHLLSVGYHRVKDLALAGDRAKRYNLSYVYLIPNRGIEIFADVQKAKLNRTSGNLKDLDTISIGSRIKF